jgi:plasmid stability protein
VARAVSLNDSNAVIDYNRSLAREKIMATLTIRDLDDSLKLKLRLRAAGQNRSMEEEARQILRAALQDSTPEAGTFVARIRKRFEGLGDVLLPIEPREAIRPPLEINEVPASPARDRLSKGGKAGPAASAKPRRKP